MVYTLIESLAANTQSGWHLSLYGISTASLCACVTLPVAAGPSLLLLLLLLPMSPLLCPLLLPSSVLRFEGMPSLHRSGAADIRCSCCNEHRHSPDCSSSLEGRCNPPGPEPPSSLGN